MLNLKCHDSIGGYTTLEVKLAHTIEGKTKILSRANRIKGQLEAFCKAIESEQDEYEIMQLLASCRGALNGLMAEVVEGLIREHIIKADNKKMAAEAAEELVDIMRSFLK